MQAYSNPKRESDPYALPDIEIFYAVEGEFISNEDDSDYPAGFYYWYCLPGCLPDGDPIGPFESEEQALADAQSEAWQFDDEGDSE